MNADRTDERGIWRNRNFLLLLSGQVVSFVGNQVQDLALPLVVLALTGSPTQAGLMLGLHTAAYLLFGLVAGALVDRWDRKRTMIWCEILRGVLTGTVAVALWLDLLGMPQLYAVAILTGILTTLFNSANSAAMPNVVSAEQLPGALGAAQSSVNTIRIFGAPFAGVVYAIGRTVPFLMNSVSFFISALALRFIDTEFQAEKQLKPTPTRLTADIRDGLGWVWKQPVIRFLAFIQAGDNLRYGAGYLLIIMLATRLQSSPLEIGVVFSGAAVGALIGALASSRITKKYPLGKVAAVMLWIEALAFPLYAFAPNPWLLAGVALLESIIAPIYGVAMSTYRLSITPDHLRGRVHSAVSTLVTGAGSLGALLGGFLLAAIGPDSMVFASAAWLVLLAIATTANRTVRQAPVATEVKPVERNENGDVTRERR
ncbi:MFS transporter [Lentzea sp. NPDC004782]|uniref:MFS transporter n=1 Tax=Lentzea sp. NPDC004782 TaxID=3154458 RepID=UPI0033B161B6